MYKLSYKIFPVKFAIIYNSVFIVKMKIRYHIAQIHFLQTLHNLYFVRCTYG